MWIQTNPFLWMFTTAIWPRLVHMCVHGLGPECMGLTAHCTTLALQNDAQSTSEVFNGLLKICHKQFLNRGGEYFSEPLCMALNFVAGEPMQIANFMSFVESVWSSDKFQMLKDPLKANEVCCLKIFFFV